MTTASACRGRVQQSLGARLLLRRLRWPSANFTGQLTSQEFNKVVAPQATSGVHTSIVPHLPWLYQDSSRLEKAPGTPIGAAACAYLYATQCRMRSQNTQAK